MNSPKRHNELANQPAAGAFPESLGGKGLAPVTSGGAVSAAPDERRILAQLGEVKVDLRENTIPDDFTLDVKAVGSRVTLIVPPGVNVAFDVFAVLGNTINQAHEPTPDDATSPAIRVRGSAVLGEVRVLVRDCPT